MALAAPIPSPTINRNRPSSTTWPVNDTPNAPTVISAPAINITRLRFDLAGNGPANQAPIAAPMSAMAATNPTVARPSSSVGRMPTMAAFIVEVSKPKRNPPSAAPAAIRVTKRVLVSGVATVSSVGGVAPLRAAGCGADGPGPVFLEWNFARGPRLQYGSQYAPGLFGFVAAN